MSAPYTEWRGQNFQLQQVGWSNTATDLSRPIAGIFGRTWSVQGELLSDVTCVHIAEHFKCYSDRERPMGGRHATGADTPSSEFGSINGYHRADPCKPFDLYAGRRTIALVGTA